MWPTVFQCSIKGILNQTFFLLFLLANLALQSLCQLWMHDRLLEVLSHLQTLLEELLKITDREELDILERGLGLVSVIDLLEEAFKYFSGDEVLEGVVLDIYESVKAYYTEEGVCCGYRYDIDI